MNEYNSVATKSAVRKETYLVDCLGGYIFSKELFEKDLYRDTFKENRREQSVPIHAIQKPGSLLSSQK
ncbi:MAG: hypothetical protein HQM10_14100 [Candidatus Riflebacteria bacterium]|nr:hypothetical protein [Candidatus Riflebacteria bacterium]